MNKKLAFRWGLALGTIVIFVGLLQLFPFFPRSNPPIVSEPVWDSQQTRELARRACFDCHSNETVWPWYAHVSPLQWMIVHDVLEGRHVFNLSEWHTGDMNGRKAAKAIIAGDMPLVQYRLLHPTARLNAKEKEQLINGLEASLK